MKFQFDHDYHIHSYLSTCSRHPEQTAENILKYAKENGLKRICLTNHYWDSAVPGANEWYAPQNYEHLAKALPLPQDEGVEFLFGCETDLDMYMTLGIPPERYNDFDFIIVPTTHLHKIGFEITEEESASLEARARLWTERLEAVLNMELPFGKVGIAHLASIHVGVTTHEDYLRILNLIPTEDMERLFTKAAKLGCGIELNQMDVKCDDADVDTVFRMFRVAKACGCKFYLGSDSHVPPHLVRAPERLKRAIDILGLEESDKFHIAMKKRK